MPAKLLHRRAWDSGGDRRAEPGIGSGWYYLRLVLQGRRLVRTPLGRAHDTSLSADKLVSLAGGTDDTWADVDDVTEEDCALRLVRGRSLWVGGWVGMGAWLVAAMLFWQWVFISGLYKWIGSAPAFHLHTLKTALFKSTQ